MLKILLIQLRRIGDVLMTTPAISALGQAYPDAEITFVTETPSDQILKYNSHIHKTVLFPKKASLVEKFKLLNTLRRDKYDIIIDFMGNPRTVFFTAYIGAKKKIGFKFGARSFFYTDAVDIKGKEADRINDYAVKDKFALLRVLGVYPKNYSLVFNVTDKEKKDTARTLKELGVLSDDLLVTMSPVSRQKYKIWNPDNFALIADDVIRKYKAKVLLIHGPGEEHFTENVRKAMNEEPLSVFEHDSLFKVRALFERANLHIGNDNGVRHIAVASGLPSVAVFGRVRASNWTPPDSEIHYSLEYDPGCKNFCRYPRCGLECLQVPVNNVKKAVDAMLSNIVLKYPS